MSETTLPVTSHPWICLPATVSYQEGSVDVSILFDSGAGANLMDKEFVYSVKLPLIEIDVP